MEHVKAVMAMAVVVVLAMVFEAQAQCPSINEYVACQPAVSVVNGMPSVQCCQKVREVLNLPNGAECLCSAMTSSIAKGLGIVKEEALKLPSKCKKLIGLEYKPGYKCDGSIVP